VRDLEFEFDTKFLENSRRNAVGMDEIVGSNPKEWLKLGKRRSGRERSVIMLLARCDRDGEETSDLGWSWDFDAADVEYLQVQVASFGLGW
jgi:hypothetical protein